MNIFFLAMKKKTKYIIYMWNFLLIIIILSGFGFILSKLYGLNMKMEEGYIIGSIITFLIILIFNNNKFKLNANYNKLFTIIALTTAFIGSALWFTGEYLTYIGKEEHPLLDPLGAFSCTISALLTLIIFILNK